MKNLSIFLFAVLISFTSFAQETKEPTYERQGDLVVVTTYHENGNVKEQGFYKNQKLHGEWNMYNEEGIKITKGFYANGQKSGTWMFLNNGVLTEVNYSENRIASVHEWNSDSNVAIK